MKLYLDASVLVALFTTDAHSDHAAELIRPGEASILVSDFARAEFASVIGRLVRMRDLPPEDGPTVFAYFDTWIARYTRAVGIDRVDVAVAEALLRRLELGLRAPDALHIAIARRLDVTLATFDRHLEQAARVLGVATAGVAP
jgi:predicted nucleic acid-binding protein